MKTHLAFGIRLEMKVRRKVIGGKQQLIATMKVLHSTWLVSPQPHTAQHQRFCSGIAYRVFS